jgi:hypothetical protein
MGADMSNSPRFRLNPKIEEQKTGLESRNARIGALEKEILDLKEAVKKLSNTKD